MSANATMTAPIGPPDPYWLANRLTDVEARLKAIDTAIADVVKGRVVWWGTEAT